MTPPADDLDPSQLEASTFDVVRRGFEPNAVREQLQRAAREIRQLRRDRDELAGRLAELDDVTPDRLEAHRVAEALGVEATQVLEAAHQAAQERAERAEREAAAVREEALAAADSARAEAESERQRLLDAARAEAEQIVEDGRQRGREMVAEAQTVRERMLRDLARRRQTGRAQVEQLRAGRDRLLESLTVAQQSLDTAVADLVESVPEARAAAERAGLRITAEPEPSPAELEAEIEAARLVGHPLVEEIPAADETELDDAFTTGEMAALGHLDVLDSTAESADGAEPAPFGETAVDETAVDEIAVDETAVDETAEDEIAVDEIAEDETEAVDTDRGPALYDVEAEDDAGDEGAADEAPADEAATDDAPADDAGEIDEAATAEAPEEPAGEAVDDTGDTDTVAAVEADADDVFAKLRSSQAATTAQAERVLAAADAAAQALPADDETDDDDADDDAGPDVAPAAEEETADDVAPAVGIDAGRAESRVRAVEAASRAMKKVLVEEQGVLLDGIRRSGAAALSHVADDPTGHDGAYDDAATPALRELARELGGGRTVKLDAALAQIHSIALEPVRQRLGEVAERVDDADELSDTVRALYRESRARRIPEAAAAAAVAVDGAVAVATAAGPLHWVVEPGGPCGPDCADNELAGAVAPGEAYPTGHRHPPAHPACTCWLEPEAD